MAGAPCPVETMKTVIDRMNMTEVVIAYGMTESSPVTTMTRIEDSITRRVSTVGTVMPAREIKITGRIKEMVIRGGENLYPREIEAFLRTHEAVMDVYVHGVPDDKYGEELMAWVLSRNGNGLDAEAMRTFCEGRISRHKVPRYWKFVAGSEDFPMTVTGKIQKFKMREIAIRELGLEAAGRIQTA